MYYKLIEKVTYNNAEDGETTLTYTFDTEVEMMVKMQEREAFYRTLDDRKCQFLVECYMDSSKDDNDEDIDEEIDFPEVDGPIIAQELVDNGRLLIESAQCGSDGGGMACGPVAGSIIAEVNVKQEDGEEFYMTLVEVDGLPVFYKSPISLYKYHVNIERYADYIDEIDKYSIDFPIDGHDFLQYIWLFEHPELPYFQLYRYLIYLVRASWDETDEYIAETTGKYLDELTIPMSDVEEEYIEEYEEE